MRIEQVSDAKLQREIGPQLDVFERRYGVPSARMEDAFRVEGELVEDDDFLLWQRLYETWRNIDGPVR